MRGLQALSAAAAIIAAISMGVPAAMADDATTTAAVAINATNFPDDALRTAVAANDTNKDGQLSGDELAAPTINLADKNGYGAATDLTGIGLLANLKTLALGTGHVASIDLTRNAALDTLDVSGNDLTTLDLSANTNLRTVIADDNQLTGITLPAQAAKLTYLSAEHNQLATLDLTGFDALTNVWVGRNALTKLTLPASATLDTVAANNNQLTTLDLSGRTGLRSLFLANNAIEGISLANLPALQRAELTNNRLITRPDTNGSPRITTLSLGGNPYSRFTDVKDSTPHANDIRWLALKNITGGYADGSFGGGRTVVRQDMAAFLYRLAGSPAFNAANRPNPFKDVTPDTAHYREILWLYSTGITTGYDNGDGTRSFAPMAPVVRQDMAAFLHRYATWAGVADDAVDLGNAKGFTDVNDATPHVDDIRWLSAAAITTGYPDGRFGRMNTVIRQDMAAFLHRMDTLVAAQH